MSNKDQAKITAQIIDGLENLKGDWKKSWVTAGSPINPDGRLYQGINILVLLFASARHGFSSNEWGTYQSWKRRGGQVQGGQKSPATIVAVVPTTIKEENDDGEEVTRSFNRMKTYSVFNIDQVDGVDKRHVAKLNDNELVDVCETYIANTGATIKTSTSAQPAFYPLRDNITMPTVKNFRNTPAYYSTLLHELTHWTGHKSRLNRNMSTDMRSDEYAFEELIAELGAAFLCAELGVVEDEMRQDHIEYIGSWLKLLRKDNKAIFEAARLANKAKQYLDGLQQEERKVA